MRWTYLLPDGTTASSLVLGLLLSACSDTEIDSLPALQIDLGDPIRVQSAAASVETARSALRLVFHDRERNRELTREAPRRGAFYERGDSVFDLGRVQAAHPTSDGAALEVEARGETARVTLRFVTERTIEVTIEPPAGESLTALGSHLASPPDEAIFGLTERPRDSPLVAPGVVDIPADDVIPVEVGSLDRRGEKVEMFIRPTFSLYTPFLQSSRGYGLSVDGSAAGVFDVAQADPEILRFRFESGRGAESQRLRYHVFLGPSHATILDEYTRLTGRPLVPPDWAFLPWRWRDELPVGPPASLDGVAMNAHLVEDVTMLEQLDIPAGVYVLDRPVLEGEFGFARFRWDEERLPNPAAMLESLRRRGYRVLTWSSTWTCGTAAEDNGTEATSLGFIAPGASAPSHCADVGGTSFILDVTSPQARQWWQEKLADFVTTQRLDGFKLDRGEEHIPSEVTDIWADGRDGREVHNDYVRLQTALHHEALETARPDGDFVLFTRSGYTGSQRHSIVWGGDIPGSESFGAGPGTDLGLRAAILGQLRAAFMGFPIWGSDTGGYYEFKDREVFARWIEFSAFSGIMEIGGKGTHAPWDMPTEPRFDQEMIDIYRRYSQVRVALQDYIVRAAREAGDTGMPIARPLRFVYPDDAEVADLWDEYLFGPDLLVAPVWRTGDRSREVYLPEGEWRSWWDPSERHAGPARLTVATPLGVIPVYVREGGEVPAPPLGVCPRDGAVARNARRRERKEPPPKAYPQRYVEWGGDAAISDAWRFVVGVHYGDRLRGG